VPCSGYESLSARDVILRQTLLSNDFPDAPNGETGAKIEGEMRRATITIGDEIEAQLDAWIRRQDAAPPLTAVVRTALQEFLARRGFAAPSAKLHITPSRKGSGSRDVSVAHDRYLAGK
jgi:hypothetical protein